MSFDEETFARIVESNALLPHITEDAVTAALTGFPLKLSPGSDMNWLALAVRCASCLTLPNKSDVPALTNDSDVPERTSNAEIRGHLERLAKLAGSTWRKLFQIDDAVVSRLWDHAYHNWDGEGGINEDGAGNFIGEPSDYRRFNAAVAELDWLASFLREAAKATPRQSGPWPESEKKQRRVERGQYLAVIYEAAFGELVSANNFPTDRRIRAQTPFMDFYYRMVKLAFGVRETTNLTEVVKKACREHKKQPTTFAKGIIPGL